MKICRFQSLYMPIIKLNTSLIFNKKIYIVYKKVLTCNTKLKLTHIEINQHYFLLFFLTFVMRILYASINSELSWQPASSCQTSPLRASGMPFFASCWTCLGLCDRFWCHLTRTSCHASRRLSSVTSLLTTPDPLNKGSSPSEK